MIVSCQECTKKYQLAEDKIPEEGLQVRCANCGFTWLVQKPSSKAPEAQPVSPEPILPENFEKPVEVAPSSTTVTPKQVTDIFEAPPAQLIANSSFLQRIKFDWIVLGLGVATLVIIVFLDYFYNPTLFNSLTNQLNYPSSSTQEALEKLNEPDTPAYQAKNVPYRPDEPGVSKYDK
jgi:predicted Zn finger-like uncharacterized protein